ncbi:MAG: AmmeMemoRadiSam system protein B [Acidobacteriia bacterium]|nr:AmmeMemoRadiSam system protein B [Terriglobia bacterium]
MSAVHISPFSGPWYPDSAADLERLLEERFEESRARTGPFLTAGGMGFVVPHAAPWYSGAVAAAVYRSLQQQRPERIVVLAFPHHGRLNGIAAPDTEAIATPFGEVAIDREFAGPFNRVAEGRVCDHSFEIQLPFLQKAVPHGCVTPLYVGHMSEDERHAAAGRLAAVWRPGVVFVASSDFTHYGRGFSYVPFPDDAAVPARLRALDFECIDAAGSLDSSWFLETLSANGATVCGSGPIALLLDVLNRIAGDTIYQATLDYQTSGEITGDYSHSVSYAALGYFPRSAFELEAPDREALLDSAGETLRRLRDTGTRQPVAARHGSAALCARRGVFVSLHRGEELLGCVGNCAGHLPLSEEVGHLALAAALDDSRFQPGVAIEGPADIEISVLTPFRAMRGSEGFRIGRHGAFLSLNGHCGLLLPQVAAHYGWTAEAFLRALARKCLLGPHAWRDPQARLSVFEAQVFGRPGR